ncbi:MAG TPA: RsmG family class I SAM-dependent methyltransferase [Solirubrobacteraceae bacterium]|jgi:16S rRNA (guanine527-N7)-methyltransferase|nr:RsmG family class I SAM-dependent methyltransferase [Solirubrobacteraceae bacterium]
MTRPEIGAGAPERWLSAEQRGRLEAMLALLERDEHAPSSVRDRRGALDVHVADSLVALELEALRTAERVVDLGSGAGFPGAAIALARPAATVCLVESQRRKCDFLLGMREAGALANVQVVCARVEEWREGLGRADAALARALAPQPVVLEYAAPLLRVGGLLVDWRGRRDPADEAAAAVAARELGLRPLEVRHVIPFAAAEARHLHVFEKVEPTPARFPRRAGMARKRPLGSG